LKLINLGYDETKQRFSIILDKSLGLGSVVVISIAYAGIINHYADAGLFYTYYYYNNNQPVFELSKFEVCSIGWTGQEDYLKFSAETAAKCLYHMGEVTKIKFAMDKCDHLGLPEFPSNAMENYGLVIYRHHLIAINFKWFGNLVTAKWWDNLFVNEGFATYLQQFIPAKVFPQHAELEASILF
ncbi:hypothetical protein OESDEN_25406, partial [Oesophagostomum dentatum]